jgi:hypothetical protein
MCNKVGVNEKLFWIPLIALSIGVGLPRVFFKFAEDGWQDRIFWGIFVSIIIFSYVSFKNIGNKYPKLKSWSECSILAMSITLFFGGLLSSALSTIFAILPLPVWLHILLGIILSFFALLMMLNEPSQ